MTAGSTDYLSISANNTGATTLQLNNVTPADLISSTGTGTETSLQTYADATSAAGVGYGPGSIGSGIARPTRSMYGSDNNLNGLVQAINGASAGVTATRHG